MTVVLYGATGYTGRLVTDRLVRRGAPFVLAGRNREKLEQLAEERAPSATIAVASVDDPDALRSLLADARVVINCAGPFTLAGDAVVKAAVETGTHYLDSTGEQPYIRMVFERFGAEAERRGVALVPAMGFDYVPGDCIARLAGAGLEPLEELTLAYAVKDFGGSRGTLRSALEMLKGGDVVYERGDWRPASSGIFRASFDFPPPIGRQPMMRYPAGEVITVPRHTRTQAVTALLNASGVAPGPRGEGAADRPARRLAGAAHPSEEGAGAGDRHAAGGPVRGGQALGRVHDRGRGEGRGRQRPGCRDRQRRLRAHRGDPRARRGADVGRRL